MRVRRALVLGLVLVLGAAVISVAGCGDSEKEAKEALRTALAKIDTEVAQLTQSFSSGGTVADIKAAKDRLAPEWQAVISAAKEIEGADAAAAEKAWADLEAAVDALPEDATVAEAAPSIMGPLQALMTVANDLKKLVAEEE